MISLTGFTQMQVRDMAILHEDCSDLCWSCHFKDNQVRIQTEAKFTGVSLPYFVLHFAFNFDLPPFLVDVVYELDLDETCLYVHDIWLCLSTCWVFADV